MPTLTNSAMFVFEPAVIEVEDVAVDVIALPVGGDPSGKGRLVHPTLGTLDYDYAPNNWTDLDGDIIIRPTWATTKTLQGSATTLWLGDVRDAVCIERWDSDSGDLRMPIEMLRSLILFYTNPPDPSAAYVQWFPNYTSEQGFKVALLNLTVGGDGITLDAIASRKNWVRRDVELTIKVLGRV